MRSSTLTRGLALVGAGAFLLAVPATASAQDSGSIDPASLGPAEFPAVMSMNTVGGSLALAGSSDLATQVAGGNCVAIDPALGSLAANSLQITMGSKEGEPGVAATEFLGGIVSGTVGTLHWTNETTGASGAVDFGPLIADAAYAYHDIPTGAGHVTWHADARQEAVPFSVSVPLSAVGIFGEGPVITTPVSTCTGAADIA